ncbi:uncharacterized protein CTRU02_214972 [Colletotrichum truncatum]|uniref:Uncharacterized protein n=1 Tax=Colletotrichum truncatum TaxID=5467 RepID=A0ACC3YFL9_COLTU|nr:uncharacterized protein CTRU02_08276 [Colletotrichum truncatum]KAF6790147.1 hypothetical protein CTRU02_08276 [Colletotrichum truncatum]
MEPTEDYLGYAITLAPMRERDEIRAPGEDWTGVTNTRSRRKLQNRLNQRATRRRKRLLVKSESPLVDQASNVMTIASRAASERRPDEIDSFVTSNMVDTFRQFADAAYLRFLRSSPSIEHLPTVIHVNVLNAMAGNSHALGLSHLWLFCDAMSPICQYGPLLGPGFEGIAQCPESLRPTKLQLEVPHHPWIDLLPVPQLRDNILRGCVLSYRFDEDELWYDMVEMKPAEEDDGAGESHSPSLLTWGKNPWDVDGWEVTGAFLKKWGFLLKGCEQILKSTNYWRAKRGEKRICVNADELGVEWKQS